MDRLRGTGPWLATYIERTLREPTTDAQLSGHYLQVVTPVKDRRMRVTDGKHSMEAMLTVKAAAMIDMDEDDMGLSLSTLCGHIIALAELTVIPDLSYFAPRATLVLRKLSVFPDRKLVPPAGAHPCVLTESNVMDAIRINVGRSLAQFPSKTSACDPIPDGFPPPALEERAMTYARNTSTGRAVQSNVPSPASIANANSDDNHSIMDLSPSNDENAVVTANGEAEVHSESNKHENAPASVNANGVMNTNVEAGKTPNVYGFVDLAPDESDDDVNNFIAFSQSTGRIQTQAQERVEPRKEISPRSLPVLTQRLSDNPDESNLNLSSNDRENEGVPSREPDLTCSTQEDQIRILELPQTQHFAISDEEEDEPIDDTQNADNHVTNQGDVLEREPSGNQPASNSTITLRKIEHGSENEDTISPVGNAKSREQAQRNDGIRTDRGASPCANTVTDAIENGGEAPDPLASVDAQAYFGTLASVNAQAEIGAHVNVDAGAGAGEGAEAETSGREAAKAIEGARANSNASPDTNANGDAAADTVMNADVASNVVSSSSATISPRVANDVNRVDENKQPKRNDAALVEVGIRGAVEEAFGTQLCDDGLEGTEQKSKVPEMPQSQLFTSDGESEEERETHKNDDSSCDDASQAPDLQASGPPAGEHQTMDLCASPKATGCETRANGTQRDHVGGDGVNACDSDEYLDNESSVANQRGKVVVLTQKLKKRRRGKSLLEDDSPTTKLAKAGEAQATCMEQSRENELTSPAELDGTTESGEYGETGHTHRHFRKATGNNDNEGRRNSELRNRLPVGPFEKSNSKDCLAKVRGNKVRNVDLHGVTSARPEEQVRKRQRLTVTGAKRFGQSENEGSKSEQLKNEASLRGQNNNIDNNIWEFRLKNLVQHMVSPLTHPISLAIRKPLTSPNYSSSGVPTNNHYAGESYTVTVHNMADQALAGNERSGPGVNPKATAQTEGATTQTSKPVVVQAPTGGQAQVQVQKQGFNEVQQASPRIAVPRRGRRGRPPGRGTRGGLTARVTRSRDKGLDIDQAAAVPVVEIDGDNADSGTKVAVLQAGPGATGADDDVTATKTEKMMADTVGEAVEHAVEKVLETAPSDRVISVDVDIDVAEAPKGDEIMKGVVGKKANGRSESKGVDSRGAENANEGPEAEVVKFTDLDSKSDADVEMVDAVDGNKGTVVLVPNNEESVNVSGPSTNRDRGEDAVTEDTKRAIEKASAKVHADLEAIRRIRRARDENPLAFLLMPDIFMDQRGDALLPQVETRARVDNDMNVRAQAAAQIPDSAPI